MEGSRARTWLASLLALVACVLMLEIADAEPAALLLPAVFPLIAAGLLHVRKLQAQLIARGALWAVIILNLLIAHLDERTPEKGIAAVVCSALALLVAGRGAADPGSFRPAAYQRILTLSLVLALADAFTLWMWTSFALLGGAPVKTTIGFTACALVTLVGVIGLYRLRMWGLALNVIANVGIAIVFGLQIIEVRELRIVFIASAIVQLLLALPVLVGVLRRRPLELPAWLARASSALVPVALVGVIALAVQPMFGRSILIRIATWLLH